MDDVHCRRNVWEGGINVLLLKYSPDRKNLTMASTKKRTCIKMWQQNHQYWKIYIYIRLNKQGKTKIQWFNPLFLQINA